jgi:hypothetical protein
MTRTLFVVLGLVLLFGVTSAADAGTVAFGRMIQVDGGPPFPDIGSFVIDDNGKTTLNVQMPACPNTWFSVELLCDLFDDVPNTAFKTDKSGKFVGELPSGFAGFQGGCPVPVIAAAGGTPPCVIINGF